MSHTTVSPETPPATREPGRFRRSLDRHWYAWAMVLPTVVVLAVLVLYPLAQGILQSFTNLNEANQNEVICTKTLGGGEECKPNPRQAEFVGLQNYVDLLTGERGKFWLMFATRGVDGLLRVLPLHARARARGPAQPQFRGRGLYRVLLIVPGRCPRS